MPRMVLKITNLHILRYLPTCWLFLLERYTIDNQRCTHTASKDVWGLYGICKRKAVINVAKIKKEIIVEDVLVFLVRTL